LLAVFALAACGQASDREASRDNAADLTADASSTAPGLSVTAAPGVAFNYRYAFRLPSARIAAVQEQHAQACEQLGLARCRITGAKYRVVGEREIEAMLAFKLDPTVARTFGKTGVDAVGKAQGMLVDAEIEGAEVEPTTEGSVRREALATTPMVFHYGSGELIPGFDTRGPIRAAMVRAGENFIAGVSTLLVLLITALPWAALALGGWWLLSLLRTRFSWLLPPRMTAEA
jgi:hypothetical protein